MNDTADVQDPKKSYFKQWLAAKISASAAKRRVKELEEEVAQLRATVGATEPMSLEIWDTIPQDMRDRLASQAIFLENASTRNALARLGFKFSMKGHSVAPNERKRLSLTVERVFNTPGVQALLRRD